MKCGRKIVSGHDSRNYALFGQEAIGSTWSLAKMNMFLHGKTTIKSSGTIPFATRKFLDKNGDLMLLEVVTANPPFSLDGSKVLLTRPRTISLAVFVAVYSAED
ncbi:N-6 DNA methylase [Klebsiella pneumoniae]